jgi:nuclear GTP-binding protein
MCPRESVVAWATHLRTSHLTLVFSASGDGSGTFKDALGVTTVLELLGEWATQKGCDFVVAVVGTTNVSFRFAWLDSTSDIVTKVGKSSVINALSRKPSCSVYKLSNKPVQTPSTTMYPQEVVVKSEGQSIRLIDTPGLFWEHPENVSKEDAAILKARDILLRSRGRIDHLKDPLPPCVCLCCSTAERVFTQPL